MSQAQQEQDANAAVIAEFRANKGEVKAPYDDPPPMLLLHTVGRKSGKAHVVPMRGMPAGASFYVFGSAHGKPTQPDWYYNLIAQPDITIERGTESAAGSRYRGRWRRARPHLRPPGRQIPDLRRV